MIKNNLDDFPMPTTIHHMDYSFPEFIDVEVVSIMAISKKDINAINNFLNSTKYKQYSKDDLEKLIFIHACRHLDYEYEPSYFTLNYLILDYKISEKNSINEMTDDSKKELVQNFFDLRKLQIDLNDELENKDINIKKMKV